MVNGDGDETKNLSGSGLIKIAITPLRSKKRSLAIPLKLH